MKIKVNKKETLELLEVGDIVLSYNTNSIFSRVIGRATDSEWSHVFMYIGQENIVESAGGGVKINPIDKYFEGHHNLAILRVKAASKNERILLSKSVLKYVGKRYGWFQILWYLFLRKIGKSEDPKWHRDFQKRGMVCSEAIAQGMKDLGLEVKPGFKPAGVEPVDFAQSDQFKEIFHEHVDEGHDETKHDH